jgi:hypothetical protein
VNGLRTGTMLKWCPCRRPYCKTQPTLKCEERNLRRGPSPTTETAVSGTLFQAPASPSLPLVSMPRVDVRRVEKGEEEGEDAPGRTLPPERQYRCGVAGRYRGRRSRARSSGFPRAPDRRRPLSQTDSDASRVRYFNTWLHLRVLGGRTLTSSRGVLCRARLRVLTAAGT